MINVYKFGGASIASADKIKNVCNIISTGGELVVVVSALGKTTNALEVLLNHFLAGDKVAMKKSLDNLYLSHYSIVKELGMSDDVLSAIFVEMDSVLSKTANKEHQDGDYDFWYDALVSYGEMLSTTILVAYLNHIGIDAALLDARKLIVTDNRHRDANIDIDLSKMRFNEAIEKTKKIKVHVVQGFIGSSLLGETTTLGREGSDYSAAVIAQLLGSSSLTIWKDVEGILTADPRLYDDAKLVPQLNYHDAVELAYSGAQVIHPKTIRPLFNNNIELYVRSFVDPTKRGSVINGERSNITNPFIIVKKDQILFTITPKDFSFVLEESFEHIFTIANEHRQKVNMVQNSAVSISLVVDSSRYFDEFLSYLKQHYKVAYNGSLELITVRGDFSDNQAKDMVDRESKGRLIYLSQYTRRLVRVLRNSIE